MVKDAFDKGGLSVARQRQKYVIAGNWWCLRVRADAFPAKARAAVIELVSEFPQIGECYIAYKSEDKQHSIFNTRWEKWVDDKNQVDELTDKIEPIPTCLCIQGKGSEYRVWQKDTNRVLFVPAKVDGLVGSSYIDRSIETPPDVPICLYPDRKHHDTIYWKNSCCELWVACSKEIISNAGIESAYQLKALESIRWPLTVEIEV